MDEEALQRLVLVVDDQPEHLQIIKQVLCKTESSAQENTQINTQINPQINTQVMTMATTTEATDFMLAQGPQAKFQRPDIVLLNMHLADGQAQTLLTTIKANPQLKQIPTIILTPDASQAEVLNSYQQQCNSFVVKPQDLSHLSATLHVIKSFWLGLVTLPVK